MQTHVLLDHFLFRKCCKQCKERLTLQIDDVPTGTKIDNQVDITICIEVSIYFVFYFKIILI